VDFEANILRDAHGFKKRAVSLFRLHLPPGPGRPPEELITLAQQMRAAGASWPEVYKKCIPPDADNATRQLLMTRLRTGLRSRQYARRQRILHPKSRRQETCA
jgi:hypothetical protein